MPHQGEKQLFPLFVGYFQKTQQTNKQNIPNTGTESSVILMTDTFLTNVGFSRGGGDELPLSPHDLK